MKLPRRQFLHLAAGAAALPAISRIAWPQTYPSRPITMIVPFPAGGPTDTIGRIVAEGMRVSLRQPVIIENVTGAGGTIGVGRVARAVPDGYTLSVGFLGTHVLNGAIYTLQYDVLKDFEPVALLASNPQLIVAKNATPAKSLNELIVWLKANPGKASQGTAGVGSPAHVSGAYFQKETGTRFQFVPYRGAAPAMQDLVAGQIDLMFDQAVNSLPHVRGGKIKAYAVTANTRLASAPEIPTVDEAGLPGFYISIWSGMWAPKGTPKDVVVKLNAAVVDALAHPTVRQQLADLGLLVAAAPKRGRKPHVPTPKWMPSTSPATTSTASGTGLHSLLGRSIWSIPIGAFALRANARFFLLPRKPFVSAAATAPLEEYRPNFQSRLRHHDSL